MQRKQSIILISVLAIFLMGALLFLKQRPIDGDEGYYCSAARLVAEGNTPYLDFFYPQMPLLPYLYAPIYMMVGSSIAGMRIFSVFLATLGLLFWGLFLGRHLKDRPWFFLGCLLLIGANPYYLSWGVTVKTYALANTGIFFVLWALDRGLASKRLLWFLIAGAGAGLVLAARLLYLPWAAVLGLILLMRPATDNKASLWSRFDLPRASAYGLGVLLILLPVLALASQDPTAFYFNNLHYHQLRYSALASASVGLQTIAALQRLWHTLATSPHLVLQLLLGMLGWREYRRHGNPVLGPILTFAAWGTVAHIIASLLPDPVYPQYFTGPLAPLLAPLVVAGILALENWLQAWRPRLKAGVAPTLVALACLLALIDLSVLHTGMNGKEVWTFDNLATVSRAIEARTKPEATVLAFWSGYVFETDRQFVPGMENHFALGVSDKLSLAEKKHFHIAGKEQLWQDLETGTPDMVVNGAWMSEINSSLGQKNLVLLLKALDRRYELAAVLGEVEILTRRAHPKPAK